MTTEAITDVSPTVSFLVHVAGLGAGLGALVVAHEVIRRQDDPAATATAATLVLVMLGVAGVGRAVHAIISSASSDARRVFRARHLMVCGALLYFVTGGIAGALIAPGAFGSPLQRGVGSETIVGVGALAAALVCLVGAGFATARAAERFPAERNWQRALHEQHSRRTTPPGRPPA
jgi:hypothetical protein